MWSETFLQRCNRADKYIADLEERVAEDNAVCLCGCPPEEHEQLGEDGEQCEHEDHVCLRVAPAVRDLFVAMRRERDEARAWLESLRASLATLMAAVADKRSETEKGGADAPG